MSHRLSIHRVARCSIGLLILPLLLSAQEKKPCWLRDATSPAPATAYLLCEQGGLWTTTDSGTTWVAQTTGVTERHRAFAWLDAKRGFTVGNAGMILATQDAGKTWKPVESGVKAHLLDITFIGDQGWIAGYQGMLLHSADAGKTWTPQTTKTTMTLEAIFFLDKDHGWAAGWSGTILRTNDGGKTWIATKSASAKWTLSAIYFRDASNGWAAGFAGQLLRTKDGGETWTALTPPVKSSFTSIAFDSSNRGWITYDDGLLMSEDQGETWKTVNVGGRFFLGKLLPVDKAMWAIGQSVILQQGDDGKAWKKNPTLVADRVLSEAESAALKDAK